MSKSFAIPKPISEYDIRLLRIFKAVVESGGFAAAEPVLGITRSTISIHMSSLETRMKLTLCLRGRGGFALTDAGQAVYRATLALFESLNDFSLLVSGLEGDYAGELVILCADQLDDNKQRVLAQMIGAINDVAPKLHLVVDQEPIASIEKKLLNDKVHAGIFPGYQQIDNFDYHPFSREPIYLCCGKGHPLFNAEQGKIEPHLLQQYPAIHPGIEINKQGKQVLQNLNFTARAYQFDARKAMLLSGRYLGFLPKQTIANELANGDIKLLFEDSLNYQFDLSLVTRKAAREPHKIQLIKDVAETYCRC
ncbi:LysR family transcriptional regulator [Thalassotalea sp. HSM 43]|uniref:LysR family transcriptional regulator n=1 Tax=Thalassotalea sp. HSM 43 TaxID=2552945 RepID=UPI001081702F|nr:LysR family transcriptional regulator [Thalassotalea sp. HSM 43]QBY04554.1 LysR family transcriptional regulator [Thalassotalea sp. HSM 43]